jgi:glutathione S-transferase
MLEAMTQAIKLYRHPLSGHCHRVELLLSLLGVRFERVEVDMRSGEHKQPAFLEKNPLGQVPVLEDGDVRLADSNAILVYLAMRYDPAGRWYPRDPIGAAEVQRWLSIAAGELVRGPNDLRLASLLQAPIDRPRAEKTAADLLAFMERSLAERPWLVAHDPTIADIAMYAYTALAPEGGVSLEPFSALRDWHARIEAWPAHVPMKRTAQASAAAPASAP